MKRGKYTQERENCIKEEWLWKDISEGRDF